MTTKGKCEKARQHHQFAECLPLHELRQFDCTDGNQVYKFHVSPQAARVVPLSSLGVAGGTGQCMFVLLFAHFFHYFISFHLPHAPPTTRVHAGDCAPPIFIISCLFYRPLHFQRMAGRVAANGRLERGVWNCASF